jgi:hypothetical protein
MEKKNVVFLTVLAVATLLTAVVGTTFAYFTATVQGNGSATTTTITTANNLGINYSDGAQITGNVIVPGWMATKTVTVTNNGDTPVNYQISWTAVNNTFSKGASDSDDLVYSLTKKVGSGSATNVIGTTGYATAASTKALAEGFEKTEGKAYSAATGVTVGTSSTVIPVAAVPAGTGTTSATLVPSTSIAAGETHTYVLTVYFAETGVEQNENQSNGTGDVTFSSKLQASIVATEGIHGN